MLKKLILFFTCLSPISAWSQADLSYRIYDSQNKKETTIDNIVEAFSGADVLFYGEEHNDSISHTLELALLEACYKAYGSSLVLSLEMFETDVQLILDEYTTGVIKEKNLLKEARPWKNYQDYRPLVEFAKQNGIPVVAANAPGRYTNLVTYNGLQSLEQLDKRAKQLLPPLPVDTATGRYYEKFQDILGAHGSMGNLKLFQSQNLWDATMAWSIYKTVRASKGTKVLHINGRFHSDEKLGIIPQLSGYARKDRKKINILNISAFPNANYNQSEWEQHLHLGDFIILTQPASETPGVD